MSLKIPKRAATITPIPKKNKFTEHTGIKNSALTKHNTVNSFGPIQLGVREFSVFTRKEAFVLTQRRMYYV